MKIYISQQCLNPKGETPKSVSVEMRRLNQTEYAVESAYAHIFDRGNAQTTVSFTLERSHMSESEAEAFALSHAAEIAAQRPLTLAFECAPGKAFGLSNAAASKIKTETSGLITTTRYEFAGARTEPA